MTTPATRDLVIVGAGLAGIYAMYRALERGLDVVGVEAGDSVGGTWYWNRYPGARCDVESVDYSYSFDRRLEQEWRWTERFATQPEIRAYLDHVADRYDLRRHFTFGRRVTAAQFDDDASTWTVTLDDGSSLRSRWMMMATGCLSAPHRPDLPGIDEFAGTTLYTAQWPDEPVDLAGKRVGLIGTGSSGIQAAPLLAERARSLTVFQRTANYTVPARNRPLTDEEWQRVQETYPQRRESSRYAPAGSLSTTHERKATEVSAEERQRAFEARWQEGGVLFAKTFPDQSTDLVANDYAREFAEAKIREIVADPAVADDLVPDDHPIGTKRIVTDTGYYAMYNRENVELVNLRTHPIEQVTSWGIKTADASYELDVLVFATGFDALTGALTAIDVRGPRGAVLADEWAGGPTTYLGLGVAGFPNLVTLNGPGSPSVLANMATHTEQQVDWGMELIGHCRAHGIDQAEPRRDAAEKWTEHLGEVAEGTLFVKAASWYLGANIEGKKRTFMPYIGGFGTYRRACDRARDNGYEGYVLTRVAAPAADPD
ncbi:flavin-containing monooxygenase [Nocardioides nitrophenolicus]|uniref:flavin-containing monooxygenase n=1 Tax=Nocardioides nitrophenolicus TaxID=60489 RepID=UPI00195CF2E1|nr:NAD(P)/FAD-dependent oxidoreductase [Nocardioides nitrophenolicus]MBM7516612.1 cation diffusion facilitator CzcD-associated flavoprotein CzcO [Nocardioides nitrophenolicus]